MEIGKVGDPNRLFKDAAPLRSGKKRWRLFVDGENFAIRAAKIAEARGLEQIVPGQYYWPNAFVWMPGLHPKVNLIKIKGGPELEDRSDRAYYFTAVQGDQDRIDDLRATIRGCGFECNVFKKRDGKSKRVDIALASKMLVEAHRDSFDVAVLIAGDEDYVPLIQTVKEMGKAVYLVFFNEDKTGGLSQELILASDTYFPVTNFFCERWAPPSSIEFDVLTSAPGLST